MKILIDTNILISALLYPTSKPAQVLLHAVNHHTLVLCDTIITELYTVARNKFSKTIADIDVFLAELSYTLVPAPATPQKLIRDPKDIPILNAAVTENVDVIVSGDKHFLDLKLEHPKILTAAEYLEQL